MFNIIKVLSILSVLFLSTSVIAQQQWYAKNSARTIFAKKGVVDVAAYEDSEVEEVEKPEIAEKTDIIEEFGNPDEDFPVSAIDTAPKPYKGMIAAIGKGDRELAHKYAKQYVKYMSDLKKTTNEAVGLMGVGMVANGEIPANSWAATEEYQKYHEEYKELFPKDETEEGNISNGQLDLAATKLIDKASSNKKQGNLFNESSIVQAKNALADRERVREELESTVFKLAADQSLDLMFFVRTTDQSSINQAKSIDVLQTEFKPKNLRVLGLTKDYANKGEIYNFKQATKLKTLSVGDALAESLNVTKTPTILVVNPQTNDFIKIEQEVSAEYLDELISMIRGN